MNKTSVQLEFAGKPLTMEVGLLAPQATASVLARLGDTVVLATVMEGKARADIDYFPLSVDYVERLYAGGRIKGSRWVKREGRPSDEAILIGRVIDRSIRPLFPKEYKNEVQIIVAVLSVDGENEPDILAMNAVSAALAISPIPWNGPIGAIRMGHVTDPEGNASGFLANPASSEIALSTLDLIVSQNQDKTVMVEAGAKQVTEDIMVEAIKRAHVETQKMLGLIDELVKKVGQKKHAVVVDTTFTDLAKVIEKQYKEDVINLVKQRVDKESGSDETDILVAKIVENLTMKDPNAVFDKKNVIKAVEYVMFQYIRNEVLTNGKRIDGRKFDEIRPITVEVGVLPRTHGSAIFQRGLTQALTVATLGSPRMEQLIESAEGEEAKRYIHHYSGLPYSFGQTGRVGTPGRREIGHGALAERALEPVIPSKEKFPYTIRLVSEVLSQNGSSSMASTCGSSLALMDAGVPIERPVAGVVVGMMSNNDKYELITDIIGLEDFSGDMDFKVAGTDKGITAIQLDVKVPGITDEQIEKILAQAKAGRLFIIEKMQAVMPTPRTHLSEFAPKIETLQIPVDKIGELIGPGGKIIKNIIAQTGATVDVEDDGIVTVSGVDQEAVQKAYDWVKNMMREVQVGEEFEGPVKRILPFGAFVEFLPGKEGMVHVSKMARGFVKNPEDVVTIGQVVKVRVYEIDDQGRLNLTMLLDDSGQNQERPQGPVEERRVNRPYTAPQREENRRDDRPSASGPMPVRSEHPLTRQFQRERQSSSRTANPRKRPHY